MKSRTLLSALYLFFALLSQAQNVGIGTTTPGAKLDVTSTNSGILIPRIALTGSNDVTTVPSPANSTMIFNTATVTGAYAITPGFYWWNGTLSSWTKVLDNASTPGDTNIYNTDGTLTGNRTMTMNGHTLNMTGGNVGIGTSTPATALEVDHSSLAILAKGSAPWIGIKDINSTSGSVYDSYIWQTGGGMYFGNYGATGTGGPITFNTNGSYLPSASSMIILQSGNVGIGVVSPYATMQVNANAAPPASGNLTSGIAVANGTGGVSVNMGVVDGGSKYAWIQAAYVNNAGITQYLALNPIGGNVGIGTTAPAAGLNVVGPSGVTQVAQFQRSGVAGSGIFMTHGDGFGQFNYINQTGDAGIFFDIDGAPSTISSTNGLVIAPWVSGGSPTGIKIVENGNVGIGTGTPTSTLQVAGTTTTTTFQMTNGAGLGNVMVSDASGNGTWTSPAAVLAAFGTGTQNYLTKWNNAGGTTIGNSQIFDNGTNVGVGNTSPGAKLDVSGAIRSSSTITTSSNGSNYFGLEPDQTESPAHACLVNPGLARIVQFQVASTYNAAFAGAVITGSTNTETANIPTGGVYSTGGGYFGGNVGINQTSPTYQLQLGSGNGMRIAGPSAASTGETDISIGGYGDFAVDAVGISGGRFIVKESGLVGIGIASPSYSLDVTNSLRVSTSSASGGTVSSSTTVYQAFTNAGTWTFNTPSGVSTVDVLVVGGGGGAGGNGGGGGGAGGVTENASYAVSGNITVTVGGGGGGSEGSNGGNGGSSSFGTITVAGGGGGASRDGGTIGQNGGSGGGGSSNGNGVTAGSATGSGTGHNGGSAYSNSCPSAGGGGGGAGSAGSNGVSETGGNGGAGAYYANFASYGVAGYFAGGGGGGVTCVAGSISGGSGGSGAGGAGYASATAGGNGTANTGSGGGGGGAGQSGGSGGSGIVIVKYVLTQTNTITTNQPTLIATSGGRVGIGTSTPNANLQVNGLFQTSSMATVIYSNSVSNSGHFAVTVSCGTGGTLLSGGCYDDGDIVDGGAGNTALVFSYPMNNTTWRCGSRDTNPAESRTLTAYAICTQ